MASGGLLLILQGIASRVASAVNDFVFGLRETGMNEAAIERRLKEEIEAGRIISEMKKFAQVFIPGYSGDIVRRFARDTISERIRRAKEYVDRGIEGIKLIQTPEMDRIDAERQKKIITDAYENGELLDIPHPAEQGQQFVWISIRNRNTCDECRSRHGREETLRAWIDLGLPRSSVCFGGFLCNCELMPIEALEPDDIPEELQVPAPEPREKWVWVVMEEPD